MVQRSSANVPNLARLERKGLGGVIVSIGSFKEYYPTECHGQVYVNALIQLNMSLFP